MKAPNFTRENAAEMARRATISRLARLKRESEEREARRRAEATLCHPDDARRARVQKQIDLLLTDMESAKSIDVRLKIGAAIERLWRLVQPTAGVMKQGAKGRGNRPMAMPLTPQEGGSTGNQASV